MLVTNEVQSPEVSDLLLRPHEGGGYRHVRVGYSVDCARV